MRRAIIGVVLAIVVACGGGTVSDGATGPTTPTDTTKPPGTVQRASLTVRVTLDPTDAALAATAGVTTGGLTVRLSRATAGFSPITAVTGSDGIVTFNNLLDGIYQVGVERPLSATELARLTPSDRGASLFAGGSDAVVSPPANATKDVPIVATRRGSVVISELFPFNAPDGIIGTLYGRGTYIEVYNNGDTTVYLDGMLIGRSPIPFHQNWPNYPCAQFNLTERLDSTAIISSDIIHQFPGSGRDYPILPGQAKVIAENAIDHRAAAPGMQQVDLSRADFEQIGTDADVDNPFAANLIRVTAGTGPLGTGYAYSNAPLVHILASAGARAALTAVQIIGTNPGSRGEPFTAYRIPRQYVLDVFGVEFDPAGADVPLGQTPLCSPWLSPVFDRAPAFLVNSRAPFAIARKSLGHTADGRDILQRTGTSARDLERVTPLQRSLNKP